MTCPLEDDAKSNVKNKMGILLNFVHSKRIHCITNKKNILVVFNETTLVWFLAYVILMLMTIL